MPSAAYGELHYRPLKGMTAGIGWRYPFFYAYEEGTETHPSALVQNVTTTQIRDYANMILLVSDKSFKRPKMRCKELTVNSRFFILISKPPPIF